MHTGQLETGRVRPQVQPGLEGRRGPWAPRQGLPEAGGVRGGSTASGGRLECSLHAGSGLGPAAAGHRARV